MRIRREADEACRALRSPRNSHFYAVMARWYRTVPLSFAFSERVRDDTPRETQRGIAVGPVVHLLRRTCPYAIYGRHFCTSRLNSPW